MQLSFVLFLTRSYNSLQDSRGIEGVKHVSYQHLPDSPGESICKLANGGGQAEHGQQETFTSFTNAFDEEGNEDEEAQDVANALHQE
jgi:hypothetical protein